MGRSRSDIGPRLVEAARRRFLREGVDGASLRAIAADARTSIGMVYYYFPTKDDLFFAVVEDIYVRLLEDLTRALAPDVPVADRIRRAYRRIGSLSEHESSTVRLILREVLVSSKRLGRLLERFQRGHFPLVLSAIGDGMRDGSIRPQLHPLVIMLATFGVGAVPQFVLHQAGDRLAKSGLPSGDGLADALVEILFHGIGTPSAEPRPARRRSKTS